MLLPRHINLDACAASVTSQWNGKLSQTMNAVGWKNLWLGKRLEHSQLSMWNGFSTFLAPTHYMGRFSAILCKCDLVNGYLTLNPYLAAISNALKMQRVWLTDWHLPIKQIIVMSSRLGLAKEKRLKCALQFEHQVQNVCM